MEARELLQRAIVTAAYQRGRVRALLSDLDVCSFDTLTTSELVEMATYYGVPAARIVAICIPV